MYFRKFIVVFFLLVFFNTDSFCQWKQVFIGVGKPVYTIYFLDLPGPPRIGFAGIGNEIWRTEDGALSWTRVSNQAQIPSDFTFKDSLIGWMSDRVGIIWKTTDGGFSWNLSASRTISAEAIYYNNLTKLLFVAGWLSGLWVSDDEGITMKQISHQEGATGIAFDETARNGVVSYAMGGGFLPVPFLYTDDGGLNWQKSNTLLYECWQTIALNDGKTFIGPFEADGGGPAKSNDGGKTWETMQPEGIYSPVTGDIRGNECRLYIQTKGPPPNRVGIYRSLDIGKTWEFIKGPQTSFFDRRFWAKERYVFAGDTSGNVFFLNDTIKTSFYSRLLVDALSVTFDSVNACSTPPPIVVHLTNFLQCDSIKITSITWTGLATPPFQLTAATSNPRWIPPLGNDSIELTFPKPMTGNFASRLKISISHDGIIQDTFIIVKGIRSNEPYAVLSSYGLNFDTVSTCVEKELTAVVYNTGCDTESVSIVNMSSGDFSVVSPTGSKSLFPGDSLVIVVKLLSTLTGRRSGDVSIVVTPTGLPSINFKIALDGFIVKRYPFPSFIPSIIDFDTISSCDSAVKQKYFILINLSQCDSLRIDSLWLEGETNLFSTSTAPTFMLLPSDSQKISLSYKWGSKGSHNAVVHLRYNDGVINRDTTLLINAFVYSGKGILSSPVSALNFGTTTMCEEKDTLIQLTNTGCDTLKVFGITGLGSGFGSNAKFPIIILPGKDTTIDIFTLLDTTGGKLISTATLGFTSDADTILPAVKIDLRRSYAQSVRHDVALYLDNSAKLGEDQSIVTYDIKESKSFTGSGINTINFDLSYNTDLLEFEPSKSSANISSPNGRNFTLTGTPEIKADTNSILATLGFRVYLTKDSITNIILTPRTDTFNAPCILLTLSVSGSANFNYVFLCGEKSISGFMHGVMPMKIISIRPNPAQDDIDIEINSQVKQDAKIELRNALGANVYFDSRSLFSGKNTIRLSTKALSSGMYLVRIISDGGEVEQSLVISR